MQYCYRDGEADRENMVELQQPIYVSLDSHAFVPSVSKGPNLVPNAIVDHRNIGGDYFRNRYGPT